MVESSGEVSFFLAAEFEGAEAYSYMGFCYDGNVTPVVAAICRGLHTVIEGRRVPIVIYGFCRDGNVIIGLTATMEGVMISRAFSLKMLPLFSKMFSIFSTKCFQSFFTGC